ncbi:MAG TPA: DUF3084 domain-containing protein [bacterium]|nr:DUF3084 domain-containing protein [bacterium]
MNVAALLIPILILVSGLVAFIGNLVGRNIGRRRLTLFGLRPRYTAQTITIVTGMLITVVTLAVVLLVSNDARQALFHLQELQQQTHTLEAQIAQQEAQLRALQFRDVVYQNDQEVLRTVIDGQAPLADIRRRVQAFLDLAAQAVRERGLAPGPDGVMVHISPSGVTVDSVAQDIAERAQPMVVRLIASENTVRGLPLRANLLVFPNVRVYQAGQTIASATIDGRGTRAQVETGLLALGSAAAERAKRDGIISPPFALASSPPDLRIDPAVFLQVLDRVQSSKTTVDVRAVALIDAYTVGPVQLTFR